MDFTYDNIVIYGAGRYAQIVIKYLWVIGKINKIDYLVVSDIESNPNSVFDIPVKSVENFILDKKDKNLMIAVKDYKAIVESLKKKGVEDCRVIDISLIEMMKNEWQNYLDSLPIKKNRIISSCFHGKGYECNCKYVAEYIIKKEYDIELFWSVEKKGKYQFPKQIKEVEIGSLEYEIVMSTAGIIVENVGSAPPNKKQQQYYINTWHGTGPFNKIELSVERNRNNQEYCSSRREMFNRTDLYISNSADNTWMFRESLAYDGEILESGNPRNDILFHGENVRSKVCKLLNIEEHKKILLYAPTFRDSIEDSFGKYTLDMEKVLYACKQRFGEEYILLYRFHNKLREYDNFWNYYSVGRNVTMYSDVMELVVAADILITDYSSIMWDFSLQRRPVFLYHNDETEYTNERDFYWPVDRWPYIKAHTSDEMCKKILSFDVEKYLADLEQFFIDDPSYDDGHATERVVERIKDVIEYPEKYGKA